MPSKTQTPQRDCPSKPDPLARDQQTDIGPASAEAHSPENENFLIPVSAHLFSKKQLSEKYGVPRSIGITDYWIPIWGPKMSPPVHARNAANTLGLQAAGSPMTNISRAPDSVA
ncbi:uncharacterized protein PHALS_02716 [Plasmopara halstedii]|uniref:Uncharacterized protein n=1 Tax=Plasmopara halstedii TaxID=4781 RepID=A0A0P1AXC9_PLAHL|nr:uncharacterized protein PHALS_02716 [Plasmopara halstedii]CEG46309.1 hypothetical protein PHALS_02716 [Plasmopara halstedii]|eukprot:XP_024582678.1 hypothetical protein PHALS_02716 [Plasmopara halstedii]